MATNQDAVSKGEFQLAIEAAVNMRNMAYNDAFALSLRWELDDTNSNQDVSHFQAILSTLQLPAAKEVIINATDKTPGWTVQQEVTRVFESAESRRGRRIVLIHYAGHAYMHPIHHRLYAAETTYGRRDFNLDRFMLGLAVDDYYLLDAPEVDVVYLLDCCYAHEGLRDPSPTPRVVEIIAATDEATPRALSPPRNTLTGKLLGEIARQKRDGAQFIEFADLVQTLRSKERAVKKPSHHLKLGISSVCLPFSGLSRVDPCTLQPSLRAVFSVHIAEKMTRTELEQFVSWVNTLPSNFSITLEGAYETQSTLLLIQAAYSVFSKLSGIRGFNFIAETNSGNFWVPVSAAGSGIPAPSSTEVSKKENIPAGKGQLR